MSKGSRQRPSQISKEELDRRWELAFVKKDKDKPKDKKPSK